VNKRQSRLVEIELVVDEHLAQVGVCLVFQPDHRLTLAEFLKEIIQLFHAVEILLATDQVLHLECVFFAVQLLLKDVLVEPICCLVMVFLPALVPQGLDLLVAECGFDLFLHHAAVGIAAFIYVLDAD